mmetsp:Transcript_35008/g.56656  ORF Transcript_35008/g.56656 Transcript_35008/m.56656 type:complete len:226 (-) Transcript_35008:733-1410(-)
MKVQWAEVVLPMIRVCIEDMIEPQSWTKAPHHRRLTRLPVQPPEVHPLFLEGPKDMFPVVRGKGLVSNIESDIFLSAGVDAHALGHVGVVLLVRLYARCRVEVHGDLQPSPVAPIQKGLWIWKQSLIPGIASPSQHLVGLVLLAHVGALIEGEVPIHVDDEHVQGQEELFVLLHKVLELQVREGKPTGPPSAKSISRRDGYWPRNQNELLERPVEVMTMAKEVPI